MQWSEVDDNVLQWWLEREAGLPRLRDLNLDQRGLLSAWYILAIAEPPSIGETLPLDLVKAFTELSVTGHQRSRRFVRQRITSELPEGRRRRVRARKATGQLAS